MKLYTYYRSSAAYRVRIALNLKGIDYDAVYLNMLEREHKSAGYLACNPQGLVPALEVDGQVLTQSLAIIEYLETRYPQPALLPGDETARAKVRAAALLVACEIHPLNNLRVLQYLKRELAQDQDTVNTWYRHWISEGFAALELQVEPDEAAGTPCCFGGNPGLADIHLVPQMYNARRFETDLTRFPKLVQIDAYLQSLPAFSRAAPENQPDAR